jgi:hypothetical protein
MLHAFRESQKALMLPNSPAALAHALAHVVPALPNCTTTLTLSDCALSQHCAFQWARLPSVPCITTLCLPAAPRPPPAIVLARGRVPARGCLTSILSRLPRVRHLSISLSIPHESLLYFLLGRAASPLCNLVQIRQLSVSASTTRHLCRDSQVLVPALLRATAQSLEQFSLSLPPAILPADFVSSLASVLTDSPRLRATILALPSYAALPGQPAYSVIPCLTQLTIGLVPSRSRHGMHDESRTKSALFQHLSCWKTLQTLFILSIEKAEMATLFEVLENRMSSVEVARREEFESVDASAPISHACPLNSMAGVDRVDAARAFSERFCSIREYQSPSRPDFITDKASRERSANCLILKLM